MRLTEAVRFFVEEAHSLSCLHVVCGDRWHALEALGGTRSLEGEALERTSLFDLASLTKLFTGLLVMRLHEEGLVDLEADVTRYAPQFARLGGVRVRDVLGFQVALVTRERVDTRASREEGLKELFAIEAMPNRGTRMYSDMHAMVLKYVVEGAAGAGYTQVLRSRILEPLDMKDTFAFVPPAERGRCVSCDREHRIEGTRWILREGIEPGTPHDPKARRLQTEEDACGHAGLFSTAQDMAALCRGILAGKVVSLAGLHEMSVNRTGHPTGDGGYTQYLGYQCYVRHPQQVHSEVPVYMSGETLALSGFTGNHLSVDPVSGLFVVALGDRVLDHLTMLVPPEGKTVEDYGLHADGTGQIEWTDGRKVWSSAGYVHLKDEHLHRAVAESLLGTEALRGQTGR